MDLRSLNIVSLCTGGGGLDRAVELAIPSARPVACVEREAFAVANLVSQMQRGVMAPAPIHGDVRTFPGRRFRGGVDGVIGGIPCQPYSLAGKRLGREDERDLWGPARRIFVASGAWFILIENVGGMLSEGGAERVRRDLLRLGCKVEGGLFRASEVGASHERERLFILGVADRDGVDGHRRGVFRPGWRGQSANGGVGVGDADSERLQGLVADSHGAERGPREQVGLAEFNRPDGQRSEASGGLGLCSARGLLADATDGQSEVGAGHDGIDRQRAPNRRGAVLAAGAGAGSRDILKSGSSGNGGSELAAVDEGAAGPGQVADALGGGRDGRPCEPIWTEEERAAVEWASYGPLSAPGPGDIDGWRCIMDRVPERLPAVSRRDLFFHAIRKARAVADRDPAARGQLDPQGPFGLRAAVVQALAESVLRQRSDGMAPRIDQLRMLGNGVHDLAGAYAFRTLATDLAPRSAGSAFLVRMMEAQPDTTITTTDRDQAA